MRGSSFLISILFVLEVVIVVADAKRVMPWLCLERCNGTSITIAKDMDQIHKHVHLLTGASFELFNLGPNSTLVTNNFTNVGPILKSWGLETFPMISSFPYPPEFLDWMRQLFANPEPFINTCISELKTRGFTGLNIDFEPTVRGNQQDAQAYAQFLDEFANALHSHGKLLTIDIGAWNPVWDWNLISNTSIDRVFVMSTYTGNFTLFQKYLTQAVQQIDGSKLGVGLETINPNTNQLFTRQDLTDRFQLIKANKIHEIDIWDSPIPETPVDWWPFIKDFMKN